MSKSRKKIPTNRTDGKKSGGPEDTTLTKHNAVTHSLTSKGLTARDDVAYYEKVLRDLTGEMKPVGILEIVLVERAAFNIMRLSRARSLEAEFLTQSLNPPRYEKDPFRDLDRVIHGAMIDPGIPAAVNARTVQTLVSTFARYEAAISNQFFKALHGLERLQRMRKGECLPAPMPIDLSIMVNPGMNSPVESDHEDHDHDAEVLPQSAQTMPQAAKDGRDADTESESAACESEQPGSSPDQIETKPVALPDSDLDSRQRSKSKSPSTPWGPKRPGPLWDKSQ
jgi:hypothetical protein